MGKRFGRLKTDMGFKGRDKVFHSIRKTVGTLLEQAGIVEGVASDILGHEKKTITYGLYSGGSSMQQKRDAIHKLHTLLSDLTGLRPENALTCSTSKNNTRN